MRSSLADTGKDGVVPGARRPSRPSLPASLPAALPAALPASLPTAHPVAEGLALVAQGLACIEAGAGSGEVDDRVAVEGSSLDVASDGPPTGSPAPPASG